MCFPNPISISPSSYQTIPFPSVWPMKWQFPLIRQMLRLLQPLSLDRHPRYASRLRDNTANNNHEFINWTLTSPTMSHTYFSYRARLGKYASRAGTPRQPGTLLYVHQLRASSLFFFSPHHSIRVANNIQESLDFL